MTRLGSRRAATLLLTLLILVPGALTLGAQITATARPGAVPPWDKGIKAIDAESYYAAIDCGKRGGADPACVFWDTGLCKNADFDLAFYTPYKMQVDRAAGPTIATRPPSFVRPTPLRERMPRHARDYLELTILGIT